MFNVTLNIESSRRVINLTIIISTQNLPEKCKVFRTMPNTPVVVQNGVTIHAAGSNIEEEDRLFLTKMLSSVGIGMEMQEHYMDIMTALSGGGPSFVSMHVYCTVQILWLHG